MLNRYTGKNVTNVLNAPTANCTAYLFAMYTIVRRMLGSKVHHWFYHGFDPCYCAQNSHSPDQDLYQIQIHSVNWKETTIIIKFNDSESLMIVVYACQEQQKQNSKEKQLSASSSSSSPTLMKSAFMTFITFDIS